MKNDKRTDSFLTFARTSFLLMQRLWDAGDMEQIRKLVSARLQSRLERDLAARGDRINHTEVKRLDLELIPNSADEIGATVSVRFRGEMREDTDAAIERFEDIWHFLRIDNNEDGWQIDDIEIVI
ncbi:Tim44 domain-containing protein [Paraburkholderia humisilvae]|uniref:Tim44-like domain-containing protein n=1 Tax=Paraburkholderia humisilvae TaxID=627669 RepID=A0A6J5F910_9BURK|nr:Tim44-like domain-containing protein [Paraburkholderia humisilvae]CAB3774974.1 hypothetical protein LMG29542_08356 [Paraburkholderia humisilvae]